MATHGTWKRLGDGSLLTQDADEGLGHILPQSVYLKTLGTLLALTFITVAVAQVNFGAMNAVIAIFVATIKALIVASFFMHLKFESKLILLYAIYPIVLLALLVLSNVADIEVREKTIPTFGEQVLKYNEHQKTVADWNNDPLHRGAGGGAAH